MVAAIHVGVIQPVEDLTNVLSSGSVSGNCSFPRIDGGSFFTISISRSCQDITMQIRTVYQSDPENRTWGYLAVDYGNNQTEVWPRERDGTVLKTWTYVLPVLSGPSDLMTM